MTARGNERKAIVRDDRDRQGFVDTLASMVEQYHVVCHAWVLMSNHYHLLLETPRANLSRAIRHLNGTYTQAFNRRHHRVGHLFQGRFKAIVVEKEAYLVELCRYVVLNPVRAHSILVIAYHLLKHQQTYTELGGAYFDERDRATVQRRLIRRLEGLGLKVTVEAVSQVA